MPAYDQAGQIKSMDADYGDDRPKPHFLRRISISTTLIAGFTATLIAATMVGLTGLYFIDTINRTLNNITDVAAPTVETSDDLIAIMIESAKVAQEVASERDLDRMERSAIEIVELDRQFNLSYAELQELVTDVSLLDELDAVSRTQARFIELFDRMIVVHRSELENENRGLRLLEAFDLAGSDLTTSLNAFAEKNEAQMATAEALGDELEARGAGVGEINKLLGELFDRDYPVVEASLKMQRLIAEMQDTAGEHLAERNTTLLPAIEDQFQVLQDDVAPLLDVLRSLTESDEDVESVVKLAQKLRTWTALAHGEGQLFSTHKARLNATRQKLDLAQELEQDADQVVVELNKVADSADAISDGADEAAAAAVDRAQTVILTLLIFVVSGSLAMLAAITKNVVRPIRLLTTEMVLFTEDVGQEKSLGKTLGNEVGQLRAAFDRLIYTVRQRTEALDSANTELAHELEQRQSLEQQLVQTQKIEGLGTLAGGIAHDFNNMLYVILGCSKILLSDLRKGSEQHSLIQKIDQAAERSKSIVEQILLFSRQDSPNRVPTDIAQAVEQSVTLLRAGLPTTLIIDVECTNDTVIALADETQIQQTVVNLVTNASQAYPEQKGRIRVSVDKVNISRAVADRHLGLESGPHVRIEVADNAGGIEESILPKIFDPFFTTKAVGEGTGLGLSVVHGIVTAHNGVITVESTPGVGSVFRIFLPFCYDV